MAALKGRVKVATLAEFGALYGVSKQAVHKWKAKGFLCISHGKIDVAASQRNLDQLGIFPRDRLTVPAPSTGVHCRQPVGSADRIVNALGAAGLAIDLAAMAAELGVDADRLAAVLRRHGLGLLAELGAAGARFAEQDPTPARAAPALRVVDKS